jgi:hypothetical protein
MFASAPVGPSRVEWMGHNPFSERKEPSALAEGDASDDNLQVWLPVLLHLAPQQRLPPSSQLARPWCRLRTIR